MELKNVVDLDITKLVTQGLYYGLFISITVGFISQGLNFAIKLLKRS